MGIGFKACLGIAVFLLALGGFIAFRERDLEPFLIVLGCTAVAEDLPAAIKAAYKIVEKVHFENAYCRKDIGARALKAL